MDECAHMYVFLQEIHPSFNSTHMIVISGYLEEFFVVWQQNTIRTYPHMVKKRLRRMPQNMYLHLVPSPYIACPSNDWYCITLTLSHKLPFLLKRTEKLNLGECRILMDFYSTLALFNADYNGYI